ncbi:MAG: hypothetical protein M0Z53_04775 [Thermaerobacter sp.]|nr:hypothetical protein [Thermaerobacter sp.]
MILWVLGGVGVATGSGWWLLTRRLVWTVRVSGCQNTWTMGVSVRWGFWRTGFQWRIARGGGPWKASGVSPGLWREPARLRFLCLFARFVGELRPRLVISALSATVEVGCQDAALTAQIAGGLSWLLAQWVNSLVGRGLEAAPAIGVQALWNRSRVAGEFTSIFRLRPADIIYAAWHSLQQHSKGGHNHGR